MSANNKNMQNNKGEAKKHLSPEERLLNEIFGKQTSNKQVDKKEDTGKTYSPEGVERLMRAIFGCPGYLFKVDRKPAPKKEQKPREIHLSIKDCYVNEEKRTVVIKWSSGQTTKATCHEKDTFDPIVGFAIAFCKFFYGSNKNFHSEALKYINKHSEKKYTIND